MKIVATIAFLLAGSALFADDAVKSTVEHSESTSSVSSDTEGDKEEESSSSSDMVGIPPVGQEQAQ